MDKAEIKSKIKAELENLAGKTVTDADEEIFKSGFLDSINVLQVILFVENTFNVKIDTFEVTLDTLGTLNRIADYVESKI